jgi:4-hydroxythreonine-4-phosphate dehydrogenase
LAVVPISTHIPVKEISRKLNKKLIEKKIITVNNFYSKLLKKKPKIAVLGLNPHNDEFRSESEENKIIIPTIKKLKKNHYKVIGPFSADTVFLNKKKYMYDVIVGMYHDQVLAPFKAIYGFDAINVTLGLKYIRVSPDHGIAKDIVASNKASPLSLIKAIEFIFKI